MGMGALGAGAQGSRAGCLLEVVQVVEAVRQSAVAAHDRVALESTETYATITYNTAVHADSHLRRGREATRCA